MKLNILWSILLIILSSSCNNQVKFDRTKWNERDDPAFPPTARIDMIKDLTSNHKLVGLKHAQLIELLGDPDYEGGDSLDYEIEIDYGRDIDPVYTKKLVFILSKDSTITSFDIRDGGNRVLNRAVFLNT